MNNLKTPQCEPESFSFEYDIGAIDFDCETHLATCHLEYFEEEIGDKEPGTGMALSPSYPEGMELYAVWLYGINVYHALSKDRVLKIEKAALADFKEKMKAYD